MYFVEKFFEEQSEMSEKNKIEPKIVSYEQAMDNFNKAMPALINEHPELSGKEEDFVRHFFTAGHYSLWTLVSYFKTVMAVTRSEKALYEQCGNAKMPVDKTLKSRNLNKEMESLCKSINAFCQEGMVRNELLTALSDLYLQRLNRLFDVEIDASRGINLVTEFRSIVLGNREALVSAVTGRGRKSGKDFIMELLLSVFRHILPDCPVSAGDQSVCYNLILTVLTSCAPDKDLPRQDKIRVTLESRIKNRKVEINLFEYDSDEDVFKPTEAFKKEMDDFPAITELTGRRVPC